jgi:ubiquinone/menaquinone biosynthesis C-methylase UbiE
VSHALLDILARWTLAAALLAGAVPVGCAPSAPTPDPAPALPAAAAEPAVPAGINDAFLAPDVDVARFAEVFETESREVFAQRHAIVAALELEPGMAVADVGAGTGAFLGPLAATVGPDGRVWAVDISPRFVEHLRTRAARDGLSQVRVVRATDRSAELPDGSVDVVFICDTYHHFEYPLETLASLHRALRPGGALVVVDFEREPGVSREWILDHVRAGKLTFVREIEAAGFRLEREIEGLGLKDNYVLRFRRP